MRPFVSCLPEIRGLKGKAGDILAQDKNNAHNINNPLQTKRNTSSTIVARASRSPRESRQSMQGLCSDNATAVTRFFHSCGARSHSQETVTKAYHPRSD